MRLTWNAPAECPDQQWILNRIHLPDALDAKLAARATVTRGPGGYTLELLTGADEEHGQRSLTASNCRELAEVTAALLSLALSSKPREHSKSPEPTQAQAPPSQPAPPSAGAESLWELHLGVRGAAGVLPQVSAAPLLRGALRVSPLQVELGLHGLAPVTSESSTAARSRYWLFSSIFAVCVIGGHGWEVGACAGTELGALRAEGLDVSDPRHATELWLAPHLAGHVAVRWQRLSIGLRPGVGFPAIRPRFVIEPYGMLHQPGPVFGTLESWLGVSF